MKKQKFKRQGKKFNQKIAILFSPAQMQEKPILPEDRGEVDFDHSMSEWEEQLPSEWRATRRWARGLMVHRENSPMRELLLWFYNQHGILPVPLLYHLSLLRETYRQHDLLKKEWDRKKKAGTQLKKATEKEAGRVACLLKQAETKEQLAQIERALVSLYRCSQLATPALKGRPRKYEITSALNSLAAHCRKLTGRPTNHLHEHIARLVITAFPNRWSPSKPSEDAKKLVKPLHWVFPNRTAAVQSGWSTVEREKTDPMKIADAKRRVTRVVANRIFPTIGALQREADRAWAKTGQKTDSDSRRD